MDRVMIEKMSEKEYWTKVQGGILRNSVTCSHILHASQPFFTERQLRRP